MTQYGLTGRRDNDGNRKAIEHSYEWNGEEVTIKLIPPTVSEAEEYEALGDDVSPTEMESIIDDHLEKPVINDMTVEELQCYAKGIFSAVSEADDFAQSVDEELDKRSADSGN